MSRLIERDIVKSHDPTGFGVWTVLCSKCGMDLEQMKAEPECKSLSQGGKK